MTEAEPAADASSAEVPVAAVAAVPVAAAAEVPAAAVKAKTAFPLRLRPFGPHGGIVGLSFCAPLFPRKYLRFERATR